VVLDHANFAASAAASAAHLGIGTAGELRWLACMPLFHVGGLAILTRSVLAGAPVVLHERFDPERVCASLDRDTIGLASFVPTMLRRVLEARGDAAPPTALRAVLVGGAPAPAELLESAWKRGLPALPTYGLTEACSQVATLPPALLGRVVDAAGRALPGTDVVIRDSGGRDLAPGEAGEICVRGATVMRGYRGRPEATRRALRGGWLHTGDVGVLDEQGLLRVLDRRSDLIVSGGENVRPAEVERVLESHPGVREAAVVGRADPDLGQRVTACVVPADPGCPPDLAELQAWCRPRLAAFKVPRALRVLETLPRTASGKLRRAALR
jgi:O-succinylbenzoic acid--CoA ligase